jgi:hypothetical protein
MHKHAEARWKDVLVEALGRIESNAWWPFRSCESLQDDHRRAAN